MPEDFPIPVFLLKSADNKDRLECILNQFNEKAEFEIISTELLEYTVKNIRLIGQVCLAQEREYIVLCRGDHVFTPTFSSEKLSEITISMKNKKIDLVLGGLGGFETIVPIGENLIWIDWFAYSTMMIISKSICHKIINNKFQEARLDQDLLSTVTINKAVISPYISVPREYSETVYINGQGYCRLNELYAKSEDRVKINAMAFTRFRKDNKVVSINNEHHFSDR